MTDDDADYYAESMSEFERKILSLCSLQISFGYSKLAEISGATYSDIKLVGGFLQSANLATIKPTRMGNEYSGSAIFLNNRGEKVKLAIGRMQKESK